MRTTALYLAAALLVAVGCAHSVLGERYILIRLFRRDDLPRLFGSSAFTVRTLRFAWHLTTVAWFGFAVLIVLLAGSPASTGAIGLVVGSVFLAHAAVTLFASRGRHLAWPAFVVIGALVLYATRV